LPEDSISGFFNVAKPSGLTSHDVVARIRRGLKIKKVGHAGTLDPLATGVLIICVGHATRLSEYAMHQTKRYRATVQFGVTMDTYDAEGQIVEQRDASHLTADILRGSLPAFTGEIPQIPPAYSAIKQGGRKLYELARAGEEVQVTPRKVNIESVALVTWNPPEAVLDVVCSAGTYIRSLAFDLGEHLGTGAHLSGLIRTASGPFTLEDAVQLDDLLRDGADPKHYLLPPDEVLHHLPALMLDTVSAESIMHGRPIARPQATDHEFARAYSPNGHFLAILKADESYWRPHKVFI
jgi:tRNA pseudouridine55 synthase